MTRSFSEVLYFQAENGGGFCCDDLFDTDIGPHLFFSYVARDDTLARGSYEQKKGKDSNGSGEGSDRIVENFFPPVPLISWLIAMLAVLFTYPAALWGGGLWCDGRRAVGGSIFALSFFVFGLALLDFVTGASLLRLGLEWLL